MTQVSNPMTWEDLAALYHDRTGKQARVRPLDEIFEWAAQQPDVVMNEDGSLTLKEQKHENV